MQKETEETHESWAVARFGRPRTSRGQPLFDSSILHQAYITLSISRASVERDLNRNWIHEEDELIEVSMSEAQFGALVSSFGNGTGVPVTLSRFEGKLVKKPPFVNELDISSKEVREATDKGLAGIKEAIKGLETAIGEKGPMKAAEVRKALSVLKNKTGNLPSDMKFAADSLTEHTEKVVTKAKADIEAMVDARAREHGLTAGELGFEAPKFELVAGESS